jgi:hypothetical protein
VGWETESEEGDDGDDDAKETGRAEVRLGVFISASILTECTRGLSAKSSLFAQSVHEKISPT